MTFLASKVAHDFYNVLAGELSRRPDLARACYDAGPGRTLSNVAAILTPAGDDLAIDDCDAAAEALFGLRQGSSNFRATPGVGVAGDEIAARVDRGVALFMKAYRHDRP